jgi:hypothetical protein
VLAAVPHRRRVPAVSRERQGDPRFHRVRPDSPDRQPVPARGADRGHGERRRSRTPRSIGRCSGTCAGCRWWPRTWIPTPTISRSMPAQVQGGRRPGQRPAELRQRAAALQSRSGRHRSRRDRRRHRPVSDGPECQCRRGGLGSRWRGQLVRQLPADDPAVQRERGAPRSPAYMYVRNIPYQTDSDQDGIGDVCDNCVLTPNCESYGPNNPHRVGDPIEFDNDNVCQRDDDADMIGDACEGAMINDFAAGPVGLGRARRLRSGRNRPTATTRARGSRCPTRSSARRMRSVPSSVGAQFYPEQDNGVCNHLDSDGDAVGDMCDTCPFSPNTATDHGGRHARGRRRRRLRRRRLRDACPLLGSA